MEDTKAGTSATPTGSNSATSSGPEETLPDLTAAQVVTAFTGQKYQCSTDEAYETCTKGTTSVQVLLGTQPRPAVLSLQASGVAAEAATALTEFAPQALELAHVNPRGKIVDWLKQQSGKAPVKQQPATGTSSTRPRSTPSSPA